MLVSLEQASEHLRRDTTDDDADLTLKIKAASQAVLNYLKTVDFINSFGEPYYNSSGNPLVPEPIQMAVLIVVGTLYIDRDGQDYVAPRSGGGQERLGNISLPKEVHWLLDPYRTPTLA